MAAFDILPVSATATKDMSCLSSITFIFLRFCAAKIHGLLSSSKLLIVLFVMLFITFCNTFSKSIVYVFFGNKKSRAIRPCNSLNQYFILLCYLASFCFISSIMLLSIFISGKRNVKLCNNHNNTALYSNT